MTSAAREPTTVHVATSAAYDVTIGRDLTPQLVEQVGSAAHAALLHPPTLSGRAMALTGALTDAGVAVTTVAVPDAEDAKTVAVLADCWDRFAAAGMDRTSVVIGLGGGTVTDLAGFAAATFMRGLPLIQMPTTVLGMVDAAVGGKTGINTAAGKNMVGSFYEPVAVLADLDALVTLPAADITAGLGEIVKCGFIADPQILNLIESDPSAAHDPSSSLVAELIQRGIAVKANVVAQDLKESSLREVLNYGHTLGHAIERREQYQWRHGHAVAVGMVFVAELARLAGRLDDATADRHRSVLTLLGLPTTYGADALDDLIVGMGHDKKTRDGRLRFVVLDGLARPGRLEDPAPELLRHAYAAMNAEGR